MCQSLKNKVVKPDFFPRLQSEMRKIADQFKDRTGRLKEKVVRPMSPTSDDLKALDDDVEKLYKSKILIIDNFSQVKF